MLIDLTITEFLDEAASKSPAPGGGSVSALAGGLGTALVSMVCRLLIGKKINTEINNELESTLKWSERIRAEFAVLTDADTQAFNNVMAAFALPKDTEEETVRRTEVIQLTMQEATLIPLRLMELCAEAISLTAIVAEKGNQNYISDTGVAALMIRAACEGAAMNVKINVSSLTEKEFMKDVKTRCKEYQTQVEAIAKTLVDNINAKL